MLQTKMVDSVDFLFRPAPLFKWEGKLVRHAEPFQRRETCCWLTNGVNINMIGKRCKQYDNLEIKPAGWADSINMIWSEKI